MKYAVRTFASLSALATAVAMAAGDGADPLLWELQVTPPQVTTSGLTHRSYVPPEYPREAWRKGQEGWVDVELTVDGDGLVVAAEVIASQPRGLFERSALRAVRQWQFDPPRRDGEAIMRGIFRVEFRRDSR